MGRARPPRGAAAGLIGSPRIRRCSIAPPLVDRRRRSRHTDGMTIIRLACLYVVLTVTAAFAHSFQLGAIEIGHPWAPPSAAGVAPIYLALSNRGDAKDQLVSASSPRARAVELRGGDEAVLPSIALAPKRPLALRAGRPHLALVGLAQPLAAGEGFPVTLNFAGAGSITVTVMVEAAPDHSPGAAGQSR
jgi:copper(I)-binding protein